MAGIVVLEATGHWGWLAERLVAKRAVPVMAAADALHVSIAPISEIHFLLTWNCAHSNNAPQKKRTRGPHLGFQIVKLAMESKSLSLVTR